MNLLIDIGNSRLKWAWGKDATLSGHDGFFYTPDTLSGLLRSHWRGLARPEKAYMASVVADSTEEKIRQFMRATWSLEPHPAVAEKHGAGVTNAYSDVTSLGVDRWLAMLAAWNRFQRPLCVMDCGTAVTLDVILKDGEHIGGFIIPGLALMGAALRRETRKIREDAVAEPALEFGRSTSACISNGFAFALLGLLQGCLEKIRRNHDIELLPVITGGAAGSALSLLPADNCFHEPHLVLEGLNLSVNEL